MESSTPDGIERRWWKEGIVYQIYPRSFKDSDGDGIGDLRGIIEKLDYIASLGIDIVWLNPIYDSPNDDNGYDIRDYRAIMSEFGTMADFDELLAGMHERGIRLVMDLVLNHSSDEHPWFEASRSSRDNPFRDYYHWWPAEHGPPPYRWSYFDEKAEAWRYDEATDAYYLHYFSRKQPDLNWENPEVRRAIHDIVRFWLDKGVDGFRMDVVTFISKDLDWPALTDDDLKHRYGSVDWPQYYASGPRLHEFLQEMRREVLDRYDVVSVGEAAGVTLDQAVDLVAADRGELDMFFHFDAVSLGLSDVGYKQLDPAGWRLSDFKRVHSAWSDVFAERGWGSVYLGNHDQPRMVSRWASDSATHRDYAAKMLHTFLLTMRSTPYVYFGDEIGMANIRFDRIDDYRDLETINWYHLLEAEGKDADRYLEDWKITARDNGRTPFQWDETVNAGFTEGEPWIRVNPDHVSYNAAAQEDDPDSILNYFRRLVALRKGDPVFVYGDYTLLVPNDEQVFAYTRRLREEGILVLLNFSDTSADFDLSTDLPTDEVLINNYPDVDRVPDRIRLRPYQALVLAHA
jgi:oligo-1,6-glucosidase